MCRSFPTRSSSSRGCSPVMTEHSRIQKDRVRLAFSRAAPTYEASAELQRLVSDEMLQRLEFIRMQPERVLDAGCGTGMGLRGLEKKYRKAQVVGVDFAEGMLREARRGGRFWHRPLLAGGDIECLPVRSDAVDLFFSSLTLQWCPDPGPAFAEAARVLRSGGLFFFTTLGPDTLQELRSSWASVDDLPHVNAFADMHDIGDALVNNGFADVVMDVERFVLNYESVRAVAESLRHIGAVNHNAGRQGGLTGRNRWEAMVDAYAAFRNDNGSYPATYEVIFGHAIRPEVVSADSHGVARIPISGLKPSR